MRFVVAALLLANLAFFAWTQGWLDTLVGVRAQGEREPERLARQVRPERIRLLSPDDAAHPAAPAAAPSAPAPAATSLACLQAGPFAPAEIGAAEAALQSIQPALAAGRYASLKIEQPGVWLVYMGRFAGPDGVQQKEAELARINVASEPLLEPAELAPGLALGRFDSKAAAEAGLARMVQRGVRTARVAVLAPPAVVHVLRVERADVELQAKLLSASDGPLAARRFELCSSVIAATAAPASTPASGAPAR